MAAQEAQLKVTQPVIPRQRRMLRGQGPPDVISVIRVTRARILRTYVSNVLLRNMLRLVAWAVAHRVTLDMGAQEAQPIRMVNPRQHRMLRGWGPQDECSVPLVTRVGRGTTYV